MVAKYQTHILTKLTMNNCYKRRLHIVTMKLRSTNYCYQKDVGQNMQNLELFKFIK